MYNLCITDIIEAEIIILLLLYLRSIILSCGKERVVKMNSINNFIMKPKVDFCFKELMSDAEVRRGFIAALLNLEPEEIVNTELLPTHLNRRYKDDKEGILDVRIKLNGNVQIDMEMQVLMFTYWAERSLYYLSKMFTEQLQKGRDYDTLQKCIHVGILDFELFESEEFYLNKAALQMTE